MYYLRFVLLAQLRSKNTYNQDSICEATLNITILKQDIFRKCTFITIKLSNVLIKVSYI